MRAQLLLALVLLAPIASAEEYFRVKVTRDEANIYEVDNTRMVIQTTLCLEMALHKPAIIVWEYPRSLDNKLVFLNSDGSTRRTCRIKKLLVEGSP